MENIYHTTNPESGGDEGYTITKITLNRPKANAMGRQMISELRNCLDILEGGFASDTDRNGSTPETTAGSRCIVLTSCSEKVFSAGADLKERSAMTEDETCAFVTLLRNTIERVALLPVPVIAAIEGVAVGGGLELALAADLRIASQRALLGFPETSLAIIPGAGGTQRLPRLIGASRAKELIWTGRKLRGETALDYGLVNEVVPEGRSATERAMDLAARIAAHGPVAIRASKAAIQRGGEMACTNDDALEIERECYAEVVPTEDRLEGLRAFREGRPPIYKGE